MNENDMNSSSRTNWEKVDSLTEEEIDTADIPPLTKEFFSKSRWWKPVAPLNEKGCKIVFFAGSDRQYPLS
jgi:hypothetical protein